MLALGATVCRTCPAWPALRAASRNVGAGIADAVFCTQNDGSAGAAEAARRAAEAADAELKRRLAELAAEHAQEVHALGGKHTAELSAAQERAAKELAAAAERAATELGAREAELQRQLSALEVKLQEEQGTAIAKVTTPPLPANPPPCITPSPAAAGTIELTLRDGAVHQQLKEEMAAAVAEKEAAAQQVRTQSTPSPLFPAPPGRRSTLSRGRLPTV